MKVFAVLALLVCVVNAKSAIKIGAFSYDSCDTSAQVQVTYLSVSPDPIVVPGEVVISLTATGTSDIVSPTEFDVLMQKNVDGSWVEIPCVGNLGSCNNPDVCATLSTRFPDGANCPATIVAAGLNCNCPILAGTYAVQDLTVDITITPPETIVDGSYRLQITAADGSGTQIACVEIFADILVVPTTPSAI